MAGGCSLPGAAKVLMPLEGYEGVVKLFSTFSATAASTPAATRRLGITGSIDVASAVKRALMRPVGSHNSNLPAQV
ncbi:MAG: hypothetical protein ACLT49_06000 [Sutterella wadsworthensis]